MRSMMRDVKKISRQQKQVLVDLLIYSINQIPYWDDPCVPNHNTGMLYKYRNPFKPEGKTNSEMASFNRSVARLEKRGLVRRSGKASKASHLVLTMSGISVAYALLREGIESLYSERELQDIWTDRRKIAN